MLLTNYGSPMRNHQRSFKYNDTANQDNEIQLIQFDQSNTSNNDPDPNTLKMTVQFYSGEVYDVDFYSPSFASTTGSETRCHYVGKLRGAIGESFVSLSGCSLMK